MKAHLGMCIAFLIQLTSSPPLPAQTHGGTHCSASAHDEVASRLGLSRLQTALYERVLKYHAAGNARAMKIAHGHFVASLNAKQKAALMNVHDEAQGHGIDRKKHDRMAAELKLSKEQLALHDRLLAAMHHGDPAKVTELHDAFVATLSADQRKIVEKHHP